MSKRSDINELARLSKTGSIELRCYLTGIVRVMHPDGTFEDEYKDEWRCTIDSDLLGGEVVRKGATPSAAVASMLRLVKQKLALAS